MNSRLFFFLCCLLAANVGSLAQEISLVTCRGTVVDSISHVPVEYVSVYIEDTPIGTITNNHGDFELKLPVTLASGTIKFSSIGYSTRSVTVWKDGSFRTVTLMPAVYELQPVNISAGKFDSAEYILRKAITAIPKNYPVKPHLMEGFFREITVTDTLYTRLIEAAIRIQEPGYNKKTWSNADLEMTKNKVKVIELRKSDDLRDRDGLSIVLSLLFGSRNELYTILSRNYVRVLGKKSDHFLSEQNIRRLELDYIGRTMWENNIVYVVSLKMQSEQTFQWEDLTIYINKRDFAIVSIDHKSIANPAMHEIKKSWLIDGKYFVTSKTLYRKINATYLPVFIEFRHAPNDATSIMSNGDREATQYVDVQFLLTNVYENDFSKIKWKDAEDRDKDLYKTDTPYNEKFWDTYNTTKLNPLKRIPSELEKQTPLREQYRKN